MSFLILRGISCSGKSKIASMYPNNTVSSDQMRIRMLGTADVSPSASSIVWTEIHRELKHRALNRMFTIVDATNLTMKSLKKVTNVAAHYGCDFHIVNIIPNERHSIQWQEKRNRGEVAGVRMPIEVIQQQIEKYEQHTPEMKKIYSNFFEGTLTECEEFVRCYVESRHHNTVHGEVFIIGDIHAQKEKLRRLLDKIPNNAIIYTCGDMIDRGIDNIGTLRMLSEDKRFCGFVLGNHELSFIRERLDEVECRSQSREKTHQEVDRATKENRNWFIEFLKSGKPYLVLEHADLNQKVLISHAGVENYDPTVMNAFHTTGDRVNTVETGEGCHMRQVHGHRSWEYTGHFDGKVVNIDSGCYDTGILTAFNPFTNTVIHEQ